MIFNARKRYVKAMLKAIKCAQKNYWTPGKECSKTDGLRVIRSFERVNGINFDPNDGLHLDMVRGMAWHENLHRRLKKVLKR